MNAPHAPEIPLAIEQLISRLDQLATVLGEPGKRVVPEIRLNLQEAMAARDRGDLQRALDTISTAMQRLAQSAADLDQHEAQLMRAIADHFTASLRHGDLPGAKRRMDTMFERSGAQSKTKPS